MISTEQIVQEYNLWCQLDTWPLDASGVRFGQHMVNKYFRGQHMPDIFYEKDPGKVLTLLIVGAYNARD